MFGPSCLAAALLSVSAGAAIAGEALRPDFAQICDGYGPGFQVVPGTRTCVRVGGRVRSEMDAASSRSARDVRTRLGAEGQVSMDARTETGYGPLRTYVRVRRHTEPDR